MLIRVLWGALLLTVAMQAQVMANLKVHAALIDPDLNVKPIPKLKIVLKSDQVGEAATVLTGFDGNAEFHVAPGTYHAKTSEPTDFKGKTYAWDVVVNLKEGENTLDLSWDNATISESKNKRVTDELSAHFKTLQNSIVTVWSEIGQGTGFLIEPKGLVVTNQHVIGPSEYISVQFDPKRKVLAKLLAADPEKDVAVLLADFENVPEAVMAPLANTQGAPSLEEGERVFTIGSPLNQKKIITTGIASKLEERAIISDVRIDHGNSGGPLFNSLGEVVGITTFGQGRMVSGVIRLEQVMPVIDRARTKALGLAKPPMDFLPVEPLERFPIDVLKAALQQEKYDTKPYHFGEGDFEVYIVTPPLQYYLDGVGEMKAEKEKEKRNRKHPDAVQGTYRPLDEFHEWKEYVGEYKPVIIIQATPKLRETTGSMWRRGLIGGLSGTGYGGAATMRFKSDFYKMKLMCGSKEIAPIQPAKIAHVIDAHNYFVNANDATYEGLYFYPPDAISPTCGHVSLQLYSEGKPTEAESKVLEDKTVTKVWEDFAAFRVASEAKK